MKKVIALITVLLLAAPLVWSTGKSESEEQRSDEGVKQELTIIIGDEPTSLDPGLAADSTPSTVLVNTFEGLTTLDENDTPIPAIAESWDVSDDGTVYTFHIRDNARWSDGKAVTAHDFAYAWRRVIDPTTAAEFGYFILEHVYNADAYYRGDVPIDEVGIEVPDDRTLKVTLENPIHYFLNLTATWTFFPVREDAVAQGENWFKDPASFIGDGPFMMKEYREGESIILVPNPQYYNADKVKLKTLRLDFLDDPNNALAAFESGKVDGSELVPYADIPRLRMEEDGFHLLPYIQHIWINFNTQVEPYNDVNVRKALTYAIDREAIVTQVLQGGQVAATGLVPFGISVNGEDFREAGGDYGIPTAGDAEKAKAFLEAAGYPGGKGFPELVIKDNGKSYIEVVKEMWEDTLGIKVTIEEKEFGVYLKEVKAGDYSVSRGGWTADFGSPTDYLSMFTDHSGVNFPHWENAEYMDLLDKAMAERDLARSVEYMHQAETVFMEDMPIAPLYYATSPILMNPRVKGWRQSPLGFLFFRNAEIVE